MSKLFLAVLSAILIMAGTLWYLTAHRTPEKMSLHFISELQKGNIDAAYEQVTPELTKNREQYWRDFLKQFKGLNNISLTSSQELSNAFNTHTDTEDPRRLIYSFRLQNRSYQLTVVTVRHGSAWVITELYGDYQT